MCGIFGVFASSQSSITKKAQIDIFQRLFLLSESRGKESSGVAFLVEGEASILKDAISAADFVNTHQYQRLVSKIESSSNATGMIGHSRLVTNGVGALNINNQPVIRDSDVIIHNGIVVNDKDIWQSLGVEASSKLDTEAMLALYQSFKKSGISDQQSLVQTFESIVGNASICLLDSDSGNVFLGTNNGSIYYSFDEKSGCLIFASESYILNKVLDEFSGIQKSIENLRANNALGFDLNCDVVHTISLQRNEQKPLPSVKLEESFSFTANDYSLNDYPDFDNLKRCTKCILPESFPGIIFDDAGVCNKCRTYEAPRLEDEQVLVDAVKKFRSKDGSPDCLVGLSGGRDSCYGLHVIKKELGLNPIAYTYDWGLVTDLARRNISRMCGKLGVEHILVSADIAKKRRNVRKNIDAWLKKPDISMIPLFMAGDKQFYYYAHELRKQTGVDLFMFAAGNAFERTDFKIAFSGLQGNSGQGILTEISAVNKLKLAINYGLKFLSNPSYLNSSLFDTIHAFYSSYLLKDDYYYLYYYHQWNEETVNSTLINDYGWEGAGDTSTTWRVGDGTAAFYNYIYYVVCGFTEHDTFRSNQVRAGVIDREQALNLTKQDNQPRWESLDWYSSTIGFNLDEALVQIHRMPKMYEQTNR